MGYYFQKFSADSIKYRTSIAWKLVYRADYALLRTQICYKLCKFTFPEKISDFDSDSDSPVTLSFGLTCQQKNSEVASTELGRVQ